MKCINSMITFNFVKESVFYWGVHVVYMLLEFSLPIMWKMHDLKTQHIPSHANI